MRPNFMFVEVDNHEHAKSRPDGTRIVKRAESLEDIERFLAAKTGKRRRRITDGGRSDAD